MIHDAGALNAALAAAAGEDPELLAELRGTFLKSVERQIDLLTRARCDGNWHVAAMRLKGLAASFHADHLLQLAEEALDSVPGDPRAISRLRAFVANLAIS